MKKIICIFQLLLYIGITPIYCQEKLIAIFDSLSIKTTTEINYKNLDTVACFMSGLEMKTNFKFKNQRFLFLNSYKNYSVYYRSLSEHQIDNLAMDFSIPTFYFYIFDQNEKRCFFVNYHMAKYFYKSSETTIRTDDKMKFDKGYIQDIVELNSNLKPLNGIGIVSFVADINTKNGDILGKDTYYQRGNKWYKKSTTYSLINLINIDELLYPSFLDIITEPIENDAKEGLLKNCKNRKIYILMRNFTH